MHSAPDKQAKMALLKDSFSRRYLRNKWLRAVLAFAESNVSNWKFEYLRENKFLNLTIFACLSGAQLGWIHIIKNAKKSRDTATLTDLHGSISKAAKAVYPSNINHQQSWAHATTVATMWHRFKSWKLLSLNTESTIPFEFWLRGQHLYCILACHRIINTWSLCRIVATVARPALPIRLLTHKTNGTLGYL